MTIHFPPIVVLSFYRKKRREEVPPLFCFLLEVPLQQAFECLAVTGLVAGHLMNGVMQSVQVVLLAELGQLELAGGSAVLGVHTHLQVLLGGVGHDLAQQLGELGGVLGLLIGGLLPVQADLGVAQPNGFAVRRPSLFA